MSQTLPDKELAELQRRFKRGYSVEQTSASHFRILDPEGNPVLKPGKSTPIQLANTPGKGVAKALVHDLEVAGVLRTTPRKTERAQARAARRPSNGSSTAVDNRRVAFQAMTAERDRVRAEEAKRLHERMAAVIENLGGFEQPGMTADLSHIGAMIARETGKETRHGVIFTPDLLNASIYRVKQAHWVEPNYQEVWNDLCARLEAAKSPSAEFFALLRRAKGLPDTVVVATKAKVQVGDWPFRVELIDLERCHVDHSYQRPVDWLWVRKTAATFDPTLVGALDVSERGHGASFAIMDGQGRNEAMKLVGKTQAYAAIYTGLDVQAEALFFLHKNSNRKAIHPYHIYQAKLTAADPVAVAVREIVEEYGYEVSIVSASNRNIPEKISAIASLEEAYNRKRESGFDCLAPTLGVLRKSTFGLKEGNSAHLIRAIARMFERYPELDPHRLGEAIAERNPTWLLARMREMGWNQGSQTPAMMQVLVEEYNQGLPRGEKLAKPK